MNKKVLLKDLVDSGKHIRTQITPKARISDEGTYPIGEFWDANTTVDVIVNGASMALDTLKETEQAINNRYTKAEVEGRIGDIGTVTVNEVERNATVKEYVDAQDATKQNTLVSGTNIKTISGQSILGEGNIDIQATVTANEPFPSSWRTDGTMEQLISDINADTSVVPGKIYLKTVTISDLPASMQQAEMKVEIMGELSGEYIMVFSVSSANTAPYKWEYSSYNEQHGPWRSWLPSSTSLFSGNYSDLSGKPSLATVATSGNYSDLSGTPTIPSIWTGTQAEYDALAAADPSQIDASTIYIIKQS